MKKLIIVLVWVLVTLVGCRQDMTGFHEVKIPDEMLGRVWLPDDWNIITTDSWMYIVSSETGEVLAFQYSKRDAYWVDSQKFLLYEVNPNFSDYVELEVIDHLTGNSNLSNCAITEFLVDEEKMELLDIYFMSGINTLYVVHFVVLSGKIDQTDLIKVSKSYDRRIE